MSKAKPQDLLDIGFNATQFGDPQGFADSGGMLQKILDDVTLTVRSEIGAAYDTATSGSVEEMRIKTAEKYLASAELWRRREAWVDQNAELARQEDNLSERSRYLANADRAETEAFKSLSKLTTVSSESGGIASGVVETDGFAA